MTVILVRTNDSVNVHSVTEIKLACDLNPESFKARYGFEKPACEDDLVVCCKSGIRSKAACDLLQSKGYKRHRWVCCLPGT